ncbi:3-hydroxybutyryl-CoA dehydrogenase [Janthinobacterium sp. CG_23.3]|uniref:3-hydroxyacyl-CoA dehydrogenase family protein n=1 Tax=Janthinobacterium sp. CG_23.3 TaxID=3349634 RepID=UPI0038D403E2
MNVVGVIGGGVMGVGVAQNLAESGFEVILIDLADAVLERARTDIKNNLRFQGLLNQSGRRSDVGETMQRIAFTTSYEGLARADFVIENVVEKWEVKKQVYPLLEQHCPAHCVFAANTSAIPITRIAAVTRRAPQVIGIHFMNPVPMKKTVEVIKGFHTTEATIEITAGLLQRMGKDFVLVNDSPGFVSNRVLMLTINEAINLVQEQVSSAEQVDQIFKSCFGHKMGPLETADLIGLDTILYSIEVLQECFADSKYRPSPLLKKMVDAGLHGRKSGRGFYHYPTH